LPESKKDRRMPENQKRTPLEEFEPDFTVRPEDYEPYVGKKNIEELKRLSEPIRDKGWANVNSTLIGGGVAEMLRSVVPLARGLGIDAHWYVIKGDNEFFSVTKKFHNMLQGIDMDISLEEVFHAYLNTIDENARNTFITSDLIVVHDPQPAAMVMNGVIYGNIVWRCHIDTSNPNRIVWRFLLPYINHCAAAVFTMPSFVGRGLHVPVYQITPCIDPLAEKNRQYGEAEALEILSPLFNEHDVDPDRPIIAAVSRYDIHKNQATIIRAFKDFKEEYRPDPAPYLIFVGNTATDDPEGGAMLETLKEQAGGDPDIRFMVNVDDNDRVIGSLMRYCRMFVHVSTREGFGLVVTEAMWQGAPLIGSTVGGIVEQVVDGETGFLVDPKDHRGIAERMRELLDDPEKARVMGENGRRRVRERFLLPELVRRYANLLRYYSREDRDPPDFRLSDLTYSEVINIMRPRPPFFPD
jgi:trehalose synthase